MNMDFVTILFYLFSSLVVISSICVIASKNPVHSVLWLIFAFFNSAGLFVLLGAEMLAMLLVIVYVGAVAVLFLFVVMMLNVKLDRVTEGFRAYLPVGLIFAAVLFIELTLIINNPANKLEIGKNSQLPQAALNNIATSAGTEDPVNSAAEEKTAKTPVKNNKPAKAAAKKLAKKKQKTTTETVVPPEEVKTEIPNENPEKVTEEPAAPAIIITDDAHSESTVEEDKNGKPLSITNAQAIGRVLYTDFILYFQVSGLILLVAMIGAIVLTLRHRPDMRRQNISVQEARKKADTISIVKVQTGKGI